MVTIVDNSSNGWILVFLDFICSKLVILFNRFADFARRRYGFAERNLAFSWILLGV